MSCSTLAAADGTFTRASTWPGRVAAACLVLLAGTALGCESKPQPAAAGSATTASTSAPAASATASSSAAAPRPVSREVMATLPPDAMLYGALRPGIIDHGLAAVPVTQRIKLRAGLVGMLGKEATDGIGIAKALTIDESQPILFAMVPPPADEISKIVDGVAKAPAGTAPVLAGAHKKAEELDPPLVQLSRVRATLTAPSVTPLLKVLEQPLRGKVLDCASAPQCKDFTDKPAALLGGRRALVAAYVTDKVLTLDIAHTYFVEPLDPKVVKALAAFRGRTGGPKDRCAALDLTAAATFCVDADQAGEFGVAAGFATILMAVSGESVDPSQAQRIVKVGKQEAEGSRRMAQREPRLLDDGTLIVRGKPGATEARGSWATTKASDDKLRAAFAKERCADTGQAFAKELLPELAKAFGNKPAGPAEAAKQWETVMEAGWAAWPVLWGRDWPNVIPLLMGSGLDWSKATGGKSCIRHREGRLEIGGVVDLSSLAPK